MKLRRGSWLYWGLGSGFCLALASQAKVQVFSRSHVLAEARASNRYIVETHSDARRGTIWTSDHRPMAENEGGVQLCVNFSTDPGKPQVPQNPAFYSDLSSASGIPLAQIESRAAVGRQACWAQGLGRQQTLDVQTIKQIWKADGIGLGPSNERIYPMGSSAAGLTGAFRPGRGADGLEGGFAHQLAGTDGSAKGWIDREGSFLPLWTEWIHPKQDGQDVSTTVDSVLQNDAAQVIQQTVEKYDAVQGCAIVMDPNNGDILAMANWPSFDPAPKPGGVPPTAQSDLDSAYMFRMEPGSMFKILTLSCGLDTGAVPLNFSMYCKGDEKVAGVARVRCALEHGTRAHGEVDLEEAIAKSCNISAATWATRIGSSKFIKFIQSLGVLNRPNLGLPGAVSGTLDYNDANKIVQVADLGFGQSLACTPVQLAAAFAAVGNGGYRVFPRLVTQVGNQVNPSQTPVRVISQSSSNTVRGFMESVMDKPYGTGYKLQIPGYSIAGKTGTAQIANGKLGYESNFLAFLPANKPQVEILVMVYHPRKNGYYGAEVAGPAFRQIALSCIQRLNIAPDTSVAKKPGLAKR